MTYQNSITCNKK